VAKHSKKAKWYMKDSMDDMDTMDYMEEMDDCDMGDMEMEDMEMEPPMHKKSMKMKDKVAQCPADMMLAHAYVLWQCYDQAFCPEEALMKGTLFPELWGVYPIPE